MPVTIDKPDLLRRIANVRRWSRNGDMLAICDSLEHVLMHGMPDLSRDTADATVKAACPECAARRASDLARQRRKRNKAKAAKPATQAA
jgi:hypothetical protein